MLYFRLIRPCAPSWRGRVRPRFLASTRRAAILPRAATNSRRPSKREGDTGAGDRAGLGVRATGDISLRDTVSRFGGEANPGSPSKTGDDGRWELRHFDGWPRWYWRCWPCAAWAKEAPTSDRFDAVDPAEPGAGVRAGDALDGRQRYGTRWAEQPGGRHAAPDGRSRRAREAPGGRCSGMAGGARHVKGVGDAIRINIWHAEPRLRVDGRRKAA